MRLLLLLLLQCLPYRYTAVCVLVCLQQVHLSRLRPFSPHPRSYVATSLRAIMHQLNYSTDPWTLERPASCTLGLLLDQCSRVQWVDDYKGSYILTNIPGLSPCIRGIPIKQIEHCCWCMFSPGCSTVTS
jgi:hypothetical protein